MTDRITGCLGPPNMSNPRSAPKGINLAQEESVVLILITVSI